MGLPLCYSTFMYTDVIKVSPEVMAELRRLKELYQLQSHNKVLKRLLGIGLKSNDVSA